MSETREERRARMLALIRANIEKYGHHVYGISGGAAPRFLYTIGLSERPPGAEVIFAGGLAYRGAEAKRIVRATAETLASSPDAREVRIDGLGTFALRAAHDVWVRALLLGALDYYGREPDVLQIVPDDAHSTLDVPDLSDPGGPDASRVWGWDRASAASWPHAVPPDATIVTNLRFLREGRATELVRWEADEWDVFAGPGPDVAKADVRVISLATALGIDPSLDAILALEIGEGLHREPGSIRWKPWRRRRAS